MSDEPIKPFFDEEKQQVAINWIKAKSPEMTCECCGKKDWQLGKDIVVPINFNGGMLQGGQIYPHFLVICSNCGNTKFFNAVITGVLKDNDIDKVSENGK